MSKEQQLFAIGIDQWGLVTTSQARKIGIKPQTMAKMARVGDLVRLAHGVYRLAGSPIDMHEDLRVAWIGLAPGRTATERIAEEGVDIVSHRSAALLLSLGDLDADLMEFTVRHRRQTRRTDVRLHRAHIDADDWALAAGLPTASPRRVIADLAADRIDRGHLATVVRDAVLNHNLAMDIVATVLARHARGYGAATGDGQGLLTLLLREAGVPRGTIDVAARGAPAAVAAAVDQELIRAFRNGLASGSPQMAMPTAEATRHPVTASSPPAPPLTMGTGSAPANRSASPARVGEEAGDEQDDDE